MNAPHNWLSLQVIANELKLHSQRHEEQISFGIRLLPYCLASFVFPSDTKKYDTHKSIILRVALHRCETCSCT